MKQYRRIEITAFRRRVMIASGGTSGETGEASVSLNDTDSNEFIETASDQGQQILLEAIRLLKERITRRAPEKIELTNFIPSDNQIQRK